MKIQGALQKSMHLDESTLEPPSLDCPFCACANRYAVGVVQKNPEVLLLKCAHCNAVSASRIPSDQALDNYYTGYYQNHVSSEADEKITFDHPARFGNHLAKNFTAFNNDQYISILDFGGGDGSISHALAMSLLNKNVKSVNITIIDYENKPRIPQDRRISIQRKATLEEITSQYDFVIASAIVEHLPRPASVLESLLNAIKRGGIFYARTPYIMPFKKLAQCIGVSIDFSYPGHIHDLGQDFWETYFNNIKANEFKIVLSKPSIVETTFDKHFLRTIIAHSLKAPWYILAKSYKLVGGWEIFVQKNR